MNFVFKSVGDRRAKWIRPSLFSRAVIKELLSPSVSHRSLNYRPYSYIYNVNFLVKDGLTAVVLSGLDLVCLAGRWTWKPRLLVPERFGSNQLTALLIRFYGNLMKGKDLQF